MIGYLCGGIFGLNDQQAMEWRTKAKELMPEVEWLDPMERDFRGKEAGNCRAIVTQDIADINKSDVVLVWAESPSWGTAMEVVYAYQKQKRIVTHCKGPISPWLQYHSTVVVSTWRDTVTCVRSKVLQTPPPIFL